MSKRVDYANSSPSLSVIVEGRQQVDFYKPDLSADEELYEEVESNNGIAIAVSRHELADVMRMRLNEIASPDILPPSLDDNDILDAMFTKNDEIESVYQYAREREKEFKSN